MIKSFEEFINESLSTENEDKVIQLVSQTVYNLNNHPDDEEYARGELDGTTYKVELSAKPDTPIKDCKESVTVMAFSPKYNKNVVVCMETVEDYKSTSIDKFEYVNAGKLADLFNEMQDFMKNEAKRTAVILYY